MSETPLEPGSRAEESGPSAPPPGAPGPDAPRRALLETLGMVALATVLCAGFWQLRRVVPFVAKNLHALIAAVFLYLPTGLLIRRKEDFAPYGLTMHPVGRGVLLFLLASALVFPLFAVGMYGYYVAACAAVAARLPLPAQLRSICGRFVGSYRRARLRLPRDFAQLALAQLLVVALPEEYFFRGYVQTRLEARWPSRRRLLGAQVGLALVVASALFAVAHLLVDGNGLRLAVFFPALVFGWMRQATGSILAGVLFHAASNLVSEVLHVILFV
jgi:membrane protease YdiL (CAAX protease family)